MMDIAVAGCGYWGVNHVRVFSKLLTSRMIAAYDSSEDRLRLRAGATN